MRNPLNADKDIDALVAELREPDSDAKTVAKLYLKILAKGTASGLAVTAGAVAAGALAVTTVVAIANHSKNNED